MTIAVRGWRHRRTGTVHLRELCPAFDRTPAVDVEDYTWRGDSRDRLCRWCFNQPPPAKKHP